MVLTCLELKPLPLRFLIMFPPLDLRRGFPESSECTRSLSRQFPSVPPLTLTGLGLKAGKFLAQVHVTV